jgi:hypothetical protein
MKKYGGVVTNWQIHKLTISQEKIDEVYPGLNALPMVFTGTVVRDNPKLQDGWHMRSSLIVKIDRERGQIETLNTIYDVEHEGDDILEDMGDKIMGIFY